MGSGGLNGAGGSWQIVKGRECGAVDMKSAEWKEQGVGQEEAQREGM